MLLANGVQIAPQAFAELVPQMTTAYYYPEASGIQLERRYAMYGEIYRSQPFVFSVIEKRAQAVARLPIVVWDEDGSGTRVEDKTSPYARLVANPCTYLDPFTFWMWVCSTLDIYGETFLAVYRGRDGKPQSVAPMHPSRIALKRDPDTGDVQYLFQSGTSGTARIVTFPEADVVPFRRFNPSYTERGMSKLEPLRSTIFAEDSSRTADAAMKANGGRPNVVLASDGVLGQEGRKRLRDSWNESHAGSSNAGKALVLEDGVTANAIQLTSVELQMIETRQLNREEICAVYDVAPPMIHLLERATFSNISAQMRAFYRDTMAPVLESLESTIDYYLGSQWIHAGKARFATEDVVRGDFEQRAQAGQSATVIGAMTPNEVRELLGLSRFDDPKADALYANSAMQPLGEPSEQIRLAGAVGKDPDGIALDPTLALPGTVPPATGNPAMESTAAPAGKPTPKHLHAIKSEVGRGRTADEIAEFAQRLATRCPDDLDDILAAVRIAMSQRKESA